MDKQREEFEAWYKEYKGWMHPEADDMAWKAWQASSTPKGYVVVPKEPTQEMEKAGCDYQCDRFLDSSGIYKAMIEAVEKGDE